MSEMIELIERLEKAEGPDREIDALIVTALYGWTHQKMKGDACPYWREPNAEWFQRKKDGPPKFTESLDAALALVERILPGWGYFIRRDEDGCNAGLLYPVHNRVTPGCGQHPTSQAIAVCIAALKSSCASDQVQDVQNGSPQDEAAEAAKDNA